MHVPFLDLRAHHEPIRQELLTAFEAVLDSNVFAGGPLVQQFESEFAAFCRTPHAIGVGNGTDALWLALLALGVGPGDEVITVSATFIATAEAISFCGARPVFVDIDERTYTMDPAQLEAAITPRTKAIVPVHLYGLMAELEPILAIAARHGLPVVEDACQAHGAEYQGRPAGSWGAAGCFSFYPGKNLGALGEAGAVTTSDPLLAERIRRLREHGSAQRYVHTHIGWNARMDGVQAAMLQIKLRRLAAGNAARRRHAERYLRGLRDTPGVILPTTPPHAAPVYHLLVVRVANRDAVLAEMMRRGVQCLIHYPCPVHRQEAYQSLGYGPGSFPVAERCAGEVLSLPMYPELTNEQIDYVVAQLTEVLGAMAA